MIDSRSSVLLLIIAEPTNTPAATRPPIASTRQQRGEGRRGGSIYVAMAMGSVAVRAHFLVPFSWSRYFDVPLRCGATTFLPPPATAPATGRHIYWPHDHGLLWRCWQRRWWRQWLAAAEAQRPRNDLARCRKRRIAYLPSGNGQWSGAEKTWCCCSKSKTSAQCQCSKEQIILDSVAVHPASNGDVCDGIPRFHNHACTEDHQ